MQLCFRQFTGKSRRRGNFQKRPPINRDPSTLGKVSAAKMLTLWALVIMLTVQAGALDLQSSSSLLGNLPVNQVATEALKKAPLDLTGSLLSSPQRTSPFRKDQPGTRGSGCLATARFSMSHGNLEKYINTSLPIQIEKTLMCEKVHLSGVIGKLLSTVSNPNLLPVSDLTSAFKILGGDALGGVLGKESGGQSPQLPLPSLSKVTDALKIQGDLGSLLPTGAEQNPAKGLVDTLGLANLPLPLNDVSEQAGKLTESTQGMLNNALPAGIGDQVTGLLGNINIGDLLIGSDVQKVTVESMTSTMTGGGILVQATTIAFIGGKGLAGPVISILGYQVHADVTLKIGISTNNTQCVNLQVQDKDIKVKKVTLELVKMLTDTLSEPISLPLPLDSIISQLLTVAMEEKFQESESCDIEFSDFNECKNSTGLFKYEVKSSRLSTRGLSIFYCAKALFNKAMVPVPGSPLPPDPKNANVSLTLSHKLLKVIITQSAKQSSVKMNSLAASITKIAYSFQSNNQIQATYWVTAENDGESFATGKTTLIMSHDFKILKDKLIPDIQIKRSEHWVTPPEAEDELQDVIMPMVLKKFSSTLTEMTSIWNVPPGITSNPLTKAKVEVLKTNDLQATN